MGDWIYLTFRVWDVLGQDFRHTVIVQDVGLLLQDFGWSEVRHLRLTRNITLSRTKVLLQNA